MSEQDIGYICETGSIGKPIQKDYIQEMVDVYLFKITDMPSEDNIVNQIKTKTLDEIYNYSTKRLESLLHIAVYFKKHKVIKSLLDKKMYVDYPNYYNETALHYTCCYYRSFSPSESDNLSIMETLIKHGANVNAVTMTERFGMHVIGNYTPLRYVISQGSTKLIDCLVKNGAYITFHSISKCKRYIQEHTYSPEDFRMLIKLKWTYMRDEYEKKLDENLKLVISNVDKNHNIFIPKDLSNLIRSFMGYTDEDIEHIIREIDIERS